MEFRFTHLHNHSAYSLLDGAASIQGLVQESKALGMEAIALTDHGNLFGVPHFVNAAKKAGIKAIIGCEFYLAANHQDRKDKIRYHQLLLAKNPVGYQNLIKLSSISYTEGFYYKPRIDQALIARYREGLIATTCCIGAQIPQAILHQGEEKAEELFKSWLDIFGKDYYIELQRHGIEAQEKCNHVLKKWSKKYGVPMIATNDVHYVKKEDSLAQDIMLCLQTGKQYDDPNRMRFEGEEFYLKSPAAMAELFKEVPEALAQTQEIVEKIENFSLERDILMPLYTLPEEFPDQNSYLRFLAEKKARARYGTIDPPVRARIDEELKTLAEMGYAGYMLIVADMIEAAKKLKVRIGPGRGSAAGSLIAYLLGITQVDPLHYDLSFARFLHKYRHEMADIDTDVSDKGRGQVIDYLVERYGKQQVAQITTFGSMGARSSIRDVARVLGLPLARADYLAKLVPEKPGTTLSQAFDEVPELATFYKDPKSPEGNVLKNAKTLENLPRHAGIHAAGILIAADDLSRHIPVKKEKGTPLLISQYDGSVIEKVGMLKMDLLGLKTLSIIDDVLAFFPEEVQKKMELDALPLDDPLTFEIYQRGETIGVFQFESEGMRQWLRLLKPTTIEHLTAMNALFRPGPMKNIPSYIARFHGREKITYPHPLLESVLKLTYGIPIYQEQIMKMAQVIAGYDEGQADLLRRAMGKKKVEEMARQRKIFIAGAAKKHQMASQKAIEIFDLMAAFAEYGFNRSHSVAYTLLSYQTAYLKAHHPAAFMAAVLTHNQQNIAKLNLFVDECHRMGLDVLPPDINKSDAFCRQESKKAVRFGLAAIKGVGEKAIAPLIAQRKATGPYKSFQKVVEAFLDPAHQKSGSKTTLENLALAGAFDTLESYHRRQYVENTSSDQPTFIERMLAYQQKRYKVQQSGQLSLFGEQNDLFIQGPTPPEMAPYDRLDRLKKEKELMGCYISGHPLQPFARVMAHFCNAHSQNFLEKKNQKVRLAGMILSLIEAQNKQGKPYGKCTIEDRWGKFTLFLFGKEYSDYYKKLANKRFVLLSGHIKERPYSKGQWVFSLGGVQDLTQVNFSHVGHMTWEVTQDQLQSLPLVAHVEKCFLTHKGSTPLYLKVSNGKDPWLYRVQKNGISISDKLFQSLEKAKIRYSLSGHLTQ